MRSCFIFALIVCTAGAFGADRPTFRTGLTLVKADVEVYDRQTRVPIAGLRASDFTVRDEDEPRQIAYFGSDAGPLDLVFLLDVSGSVREMLPRIADCAAEALSVLKPGDRSAVMAFSKRTVLLQPFSEDAAAAGRGIRGALGLQIGLDTDINQALWSAADYLHNSGSESRRAILIITDNMQETHVPDSLVDEQLAQAGAVVDGLLVRGFGLPHIAHPGILGFARNTGGEIIEGNQPGSRLADMIRRIKFRYSIHFQPVDAVSPHPRKIHIDLSEDARSLHPNAIVRARRIYFPAGTYRPKPEVPERQKIASCSGRDDLHA
jgi:VWFA-related protein